MLDQLATADSSLFQLMNVRLANPFFDSVMPFITNDWVLRALFVTAILALLVANFRRFRLIALAALILVGLSDVTASRMLKPIFNRTRPCHTISNVHLLVDCGSGKSMPSSHAVNAFAQGVFFALLFSRWRWPLLLCVGLVAFSRVAVGVHYPGDILVGALVGSLLASGMVLVLTRISPQTVVESLEKRNPLR